MTAPKPFREHLAAHLTLGLPLIGSHMAQMAIGMTDTIMLGWYDVEALAALVLANTFHMVLFLFGSGFAFAVMPLVSAAAEQGDDTRVRRVTRMGLWISAGFALAVLPLLWFSAPLMKLMGQEATLAEGAQTYLRIMGWGIIPALAVMVLKSYLSALERARVQLLVVIAAAVANAGINYLLIFGNFGAPELGIRGAALASLAVQVISVLVLALYAVNRFPAHRLFHRIWRPDWEALREVAAMGWHVGLTVLAEVGLFSFSAILVGLLGTVPLAAHGIALQIASISFMVPLGMSNAATVRAGRAFGRGDAPALRQGALAAFSLGLGWAALAVVLFLSVPALLVGAFLDPAEPLRDEILAVGRGLLLMAALFQLADATQVIAVSLLRGMQDTRVPMMIAASSYWLIGAPAAWVFGIALGLGAQGVWLGLVLGLAAAAAMLGTRFWRSSGALTTA
ncbi:MATE family efflux transporter [Sinisalibacter aestuarii]|uniref:Multidrug-efflux transporter n=1 Tax=Sinisalibacter aestuarii TaxID=2949426 RepID=A0ABQ5LYZ9_9RHOB|nr:MATE family efflux transporter [Sinisalibacter aestuarii]GKY90203.1 MATE family efflux transporter [Sinisalibacter aestuarii]